MLVEAEGRGLGLMTYGLENDEETSIERQRRLGVRGVIVDDVQALMGRGIHR
jgi:glycerophosphoryl diester phosphodiesterase